MIDRRAGHAGSDLAANVAEELRRVARWPVSAFRRAYVRLTMCTSFLASLRRSGRTFVIARHDGADRLTNGAKVAVFAHYDPAGLVDDFVIYYLGALRSAGYTVVFVSNAPNFATESLQRVLPLSARVLVRLNVGYDFGAFKDGIEALGDLSRFEQVVLANDSVYGPLFDLGKILARCDDSADIWGMTENRAGGHHLQSYFLLFRKPALSHPTLSAFFGAVRPVQSKQWVIQRYEIGLTRTMRRVGLRCAALFPYQTAAAVFVAHVRDGELMQQPGPSVPNRRYFARMLRRLERGRPMNPMHWFWAELISKMHCPFIKRELLICNPFGVPRVEGWQNIVRDVSTYDTELAVRHMRACQRRSGRVDDAVEERHPTGSAAMTCQRPIHE